MHMTLQKLGGGGGEMSWVVGNGIGGKTTRVGGGGAKRPKSETRGETTWEGWMNVLGGERTS